MSLAKNVAGSTFVQQQQQQQQQILGMTTVATSSHTLVTTSVNCMSTTPPLTSSTPIATGLSISSTCSSSSLSYESGVILSGSSLCSSLSNSPISPSSSSPSVALSSSTSSSSPPATSVSVSRVPNEMLSPSSCSLNASVLAAVNGEVDEETVISLPPFSLLSKPQPSAPSAALMLITTATTSAATLGKPIDVDCLASNGFSNVTTLKLPEKSHSSAQVLLDGFGSEYDGHKSGLPQQQQSAEQSSLNTEDARTLQLALELSMVGLNDSVQNLQQLKIQQHQQQQQQQQIRTAESQLPNYNTCHMAALSKALLHTQTTQLAKYNISNRNSPVKSNIAVLNQFTSPEDRSKKSQNMTECVPVPSSEHVAEIVGRQGCKIKALRAKTNTYIKTPVRNEEPVFVVTGRKEDVTKAKREILSAAEHFTLIRATRRTTEAGFCGSGGANSGSSGNLGCPRNVLGGSASITGQVTIQVRVPYRVVGLVVGPKGNTIKHIQHETQTYIVTPSRDKEPIFEVTGSPTNVQAARKQIEAHIALRTGNLSTNGSTLSLAPTSDLANESNMPTMNSFSTLNQILNEDIQSDFLSTIYKNGIGSAFDFVGNVCGGNASNVGVADNTGSANSVPSLVSPNLSCMQLNMSGVNGLAISSTVSTNPLLLNSGLDNCTNFHSLANIDYINTLMNNSNLDVETHTHVCGSNSGIHNQNHNIKQHNIKHIVDRLVANGSHSNSTINNLKSVLNSVNIDNNVTNTNTVISTGSNIGTIMTRSCSSASSTASSSKSANNSAGSSSTNNKPFWKNITDSLDVDEGIDDSPNIWNLPSSLATITNSYCSPTSTSVSPTDSLLGEMNSHQISGSNSINNKSGIVQAVYPQIKKLDKLKRDCWVCQDKEIVAALVPCGHTMFCMECANRICTTNEATCPICATNVYHVLRILH